MARLNFVNLDTVCCIARLGSFTDAAEFLHTTQPAVSARVRELESTIGTTLFRKSGRRMELTLEGRELVRQIEPLLRQMGATIDSLTNPRSLSAFVRIGMSTISMTWFPRLMAELKKAMPNVCYEVQIARADDLISDLKSGKLDLAIVAGNVDREALNTSRLGRERFQWMISPSLRRTGGIPGSRHWLERYPVWCVDRPSYSYEAVTRTLRALSLPLDNINTVSSFAGMVELLKGGAGISLVPIGVRSDPVASKLLVPLSHTLAEDVLEFSICLGPNDPQPVLSRIVQLAAAVGRAEMASARKISGRSRVG